MIILQYSTWTIVSKLSPPSSSFFFLTSIVLDSPTLAPHTKTVCPSARTLLCCSGAFSDSMLQTESSNPDGISSVTDHNFIECGLWNAIIIIMTTLIHFEKKSLIKGCFRYITHARLYIIIIVTRERSTSFHIKQSSAKAQCKSPETWRVGTELRGFLPGPLGVVISVSVGRTTCCYVSAENRGKGRLVSEHCTVRMDWVFSCPTPAWQPPAYRQRSPWRTGRSTEADPGCYSDNALRTRTTRISAATDDPRPSCFGRTAPSPRRPFQPKEVCSASTNVSDRPRAYAGKHTDVADSQPPCHPCAH